LNAFSPERPLWPLGDLARHLGWDKATTHRFVTKLVELSFLERDQDGNYGHGTFALELSARALGASPVPPRLTPGVGEGAAGAGLTTQVGSLDGSQVVITLSEEGTMLVNAAARLGARLPVHATAIGKVILAQLDDDEIRGILTEALEPHTDHTITA